MNKTLKFEFENSIKLLDEDEDVSIVNIDVMHQDDTEEDYDRNLCNFSHECIEEALPTLLNKPLIFRYNSNVEELVTDIVSHAKNKEDAFNMKIGGHIPSDSKIIFIKRDNGKTYLNCDAVIQKRYVPNLMEIIKNNNNKIPVSIEVKTDGEKNEDGIYKVKRFKFCSICLLSNSILGGMEGAYLDVVKFSKEEIDDMNNKYIQFSKNSQTTDIVEKIKYKNFERKEGTVKLEHKELENKLWSDLSGQMFTRGKETYHKYYIEKIYDGHIIVRDNESEEDYKMKYDIDKDGKVKIDFTSKKLLEEDLRKFELYTTFEKEDIGTEEAIKVNKSKEAVSDTPWGSVDKTELRNRVVKAKNFKTIVRDVFLDVREGGLDGETSKLKYPVMEIKDGELVYNRAALGSAKAYAEKNNETEVLEQLKKIYTHLGLDFELKEDGKVMMECSNLDYECGKKMEEDNKDNDNVKPESEEIKEPDAGAQKDKDEEDAKDDEEVRDEDDKEEVKEMSTDANIDPVANTDLLEKEAEDNKEIVEEKKPEEDKLKEDLDLALKHIKELEIENEALKTFKAEAEEEKRTSRIGAVMQEMEDKLPKDKRDEMLEKSKEFSLDNLNQWENLVKATAFEYGGSATKKESFKRMTVWGNNNVEPKNKSSLWGNL